MDSLNKKRDDLINEYYVKQEKQLGHRPAEMKSEGFADGLDAAVQEFGPLVEAVEEYQNARISGDFSAAQLKYKKMIEALFNLKGESDE